jgi:hypothetical protein
LQLLSLANLRITEAAYYAQLSGSVLVTVQRELDGFASELRENVLPHLAPIAPDARLIDVIDDATLGLVLATNVDPLLLEITPGEWDTISAEMLADACSRAGESARDLGEALGAWASTTQSSVAERREPQDASRRVQIVQIARVRGRIGRIWTSVCCHCVATGDGLPRVDGKRPSGTPGINQKVLART